MRAGWGCTDVRDGITSSLINDVLNNIKQVFVKLNNLNFIIGSIYLPSCVNIKLYADHSQDIINICAANPNFILVITGDYNLSNVNFDYYFTDCLHYLTFA